MQDAGSLQVFNLPLRLISWLHLRCFCSRLLSLCVVTDFLIVLWVVLLNALQRMVPDGGLIVKLG